MSDLVYIWVWCYFYLQLHPENSEQCSWTWRWHLLRCRHSSECTMVDSSHKNLWNQPCCAIPTTPNANISVKTSRIRSCQGLDTQVENAFLLAAEHVSHFSVIRATECVITLGSSVGQSKGASISLDRRAVDTIHLCPRGSLYSLHTNTRSWIISVIFGNWLSQNLKECAFLCFYTLRSWVESKWYLAWTQ